MTLDLDAVRRNFPALTPDVAYFDNAGGSQVLRSVADRIHDYLLTTPVQLGASYRQSDLARQRVADGRAATADLIKAARPEEIVFGASSTVLVQNLARAMGGQLQPGDEIIVTVFDHESNIGPWRELAARGVVIREWDIDKDTFEPDLNALDALLSARTKLVAVTHTSNILGSILPIRRIADLAHAHGARICVDGVAFAPHRAVDVVALDVDYYVFSFYKLFGPHFAALYVRQDAGLDLDSLSPLYPDMPAKLEPGNPNYEMAWSVVAIRDYLRAIGGGPDRSALEAAFASIALHEEILAARLLDWLGMRNDIRIIGGMSADRNRRVPTISFTIPGVDMVSLVDGVDERSVCMRHGSFHSGRLTSRLGLGSAGVFRVSIAHYNSMHEIDRLIDALEQSLPV